MLRGKWQSKNYLKSIFLGPLFFASTFGRATHILFGVNVADRGGGPAKALVQVGIDNRNGLNLGQLDLS
jgi:hypothetical protein